MNDQTFNDMLTNNIVSFEQLGPGLLLLVYTQIPFLLALDQWNML